MRQKVFITASLALMAVWAQTALPPTILSEPGYVDPQSCKGCHQEIWNTYQRTGMGRSFYRPSAAKAVENFSKIYYHEPSDSYFSMFQRDGDLFQKRHQMDSRGREINVLEKRVDYIMGSGNHVRAYLNRTPGGMLMELPLAWYAEKGGYWAMNPGYDRPNHEGFRRSITYDCMFCHNGYPKIPVGYDQPLSQAVYAGPLPEGIDCQRCHGPGAKHVQLARTPGTDPTLIRAVVVNPAKLNPERQMEVCMQCHLETTSFPLPNTILRYERGPFTYRPGEALSDFLLTFDHERGKGRDEKFEIVSAAYRLRRSECFLQSKGKLTCTVCHNPHDIPRGEDALQHYTKVCQNCHASALNTKIQAGKHRAAGNCTECHMPKRRTEDVVHVTVTDHYIQRLKPAGDLLANRAEHHEADGDYQGKVVPYYPPDSISALYTGIAQVIQRSNLNEGIRQLEAAIRKNPPSRGEYYFQLAEALRADGQITKALPLYREAVKRSPRLVFGWLRLGSVLRKAGQPTEAETALGRGISLAPLNAQLWQELSATYRSQGKNKEAMIADEKALVLDPDLAEAHNNLGALQSESGDTVRAELEFREAIRLQPDYADAHANLAGLLAANDFPQARTHYGLALKYRPNDAATRYNFAMALGRNREFEKAQEQLETAVRLDPGFVDARELLGDLLFARDLVQAAGEQYREALRIRPNSGRSHFGLASVLFRSGDRKAGMLELQKAADSPDPQFQQQALQALQQIQKPQ